MPALQSFADEIVKGKWADFPEIFREGWETGRHVNDYDDGSDAPHWKIHFHLWNLSDH